LCLQRLHCKGRVGRVWKLAQAEGEGNRERDERPGCVYLPLFIDATRLQAKLSRWWRTQGCVRSQEDRSEIERTSGDDFSGPDCGARRDACGPRKTVPRSSGLRGMTSQGRIAAHAGMRAVPGRLFRDRADFGG